MATYTADMSDRHILRVTVRGRFSALSGRQREYLVASLDDHHVTKSAFTVEGIFTYDSNIDYFSLRFEIQVEGEHPEDAAAERGLNQAEAFLRTLGIGHQQLRVTTTDMESMWAVSAATRKGPLTGSSATVMGPPFRQLWDHL
jgi:hypothetical protein